MGVGRMDIGRIFQLNRSSNRVFDRQPLSVQEQRLKDKDKIIAIQKSEIDTLRRERKRLLDHMFTPIPDYEQKEIGDVIGQEVEHIDEDDLQAGTMQDTNTKGNA